MQRSKSSTIKCYFCEGSHSCRDCPLELSMAPVFKKKIGNVMEHFIAHNLPCPECLKNALSVVGDHTPSLDIICSNCSKKYEVKSKCLSVKVLPNDIRLPHGSYIDYTHRLCEGLNLVVIIYGIDRINKLLSIREVLYANNALLQNKDVIQVTKRPDSGMSQIFIINKNNLKKLVLRTNNVSLTFRSEFDSLKNKNMIDKTKPKLITVK